MDGNDPQLKIFVKNQLRTINPMLDVDVYFK